MFVKCTKCNTHYQLNEDLLKPEGKKVKCTKCKNVWFQKYIKNDHVLKPIPAHSSLPTIVEHYTPIWLKLIPTLFLCLIVITGTFFFQNQITRIYPEAKTFYNLLGFSNTNNLRLEEVSMKYHDQDVDIDGFVKNESVYKSYSPQIIISFSDQNGKTILSEILGEQKTVINAGERKAFHKKLSHIPENSHFLSVKIADKLDIFSVKSKL